jgi:hypothetical protein
MTREVWIAMLAKAVAPMEPERAGKGLADMLPMLRYPDEAFTIASLNAVCNEGRILSDGSTAPLNRVPTFGELNTVLGRYWFQQRQRAEIRAIPEAREALPAPERKGPTEEEKAVVRAVVEAFAMERSFAADPPAPPRSAALNDRDLLAIYKRAALDGLPGARERLAMLRRQAVETVPQCTVPLFGDAL